MYAKPPGPHLVEIARANPFDIHRRTAIAQLNLQDIFVAFARNLDAPAQIAMVCVSHNVCAGFVDSKDNLALVISRTMDQLTEFFHHRTDDNQELGMRGDTDFDHQTGPLCGIGSRIKDSRRVLNQKAFDLGERRKGGLSPMQNLSQAA
jgi:hypothetical protein